MTRLPQPGGDKGNWGEILNEYLDVSHNADGSLKTDAVTTYVRDSTGRRLDGFQVADRSTVGNHTAGFMSRLFGGRQSASLLVMGDSTGDESNVRGRWVLRVTEWLAAQFPAYTVNFHQWNLAANNFDPLGTGQSRRIQTGRGTGNSGVPFVLDVWNSSASGMAPPYHYSNGVVSTCMTAAAPQLVIINHGHNIGSDTGPQTAYQVGVLARSAIDIDPRVNVVLIAQNIDGPQATDYADDYLRARSVISLAQTDNFGLINVFALFKNNPDYATEWISAADGLYLHPSDAGSSAWATLVEQSLWLGVDPSVAPVQSSPAQHRMFIPARSFDAYSGSPLYTQMSTNGFGWKLPNGASSSIVASGIAVPDRWSQYDLTLVWTTAGSSGYSGSTSGQITLSRQKIGLATTPLAGQYVPDAWATGTTTSAVPHNGGAFQTFYTSLAAQSSYAAGAIMNLRIDRAPNDTLSEAIYVIGAILTKASAAL